jgi:hypothetical protein
MRGTVGVKDFFWFPKRDYSLQEFDKGYYSPSPMETLYFNTNRDNFHLDELKYFSLIKLYKKYFEDVHVFLYEDFKKDQQGILTKIAAIAEDRLPAPEEINFEERVLKSQRPKDHLVRKVENFWLGMNRSLAIPRYRWWLAKGMGLLSRPFLNAREVEAEKQYIIDLSRDHYRSDNDLIIKNFPEIGIQHYPEKYPGSLN